MHVLVLLVHVSLYTKFEWPSLTRFEDMMDPKVKKVGHVTLTTPILG